MLNSEEIIKGLQELAGLFNHSVQEKDWKKAKYIYDKTRNIAVFVQIPEENMLELFGSRQDEDNIIIGMFQEQDVQKTYYEVEIKRQEEAEEEKKRRARHEKR